MPSQRWHSQLYLLLAQQLSGDAPLRRYCAEQQTCDHKHQHERLENVKIVDVAANVFGRCEKPKLDADIARSTRFNRQIKTVMNAKDEKIREGCTHDYERGEDGPLDEYR